MLHCVRDQLMYPENERSIYSQKYWSKYCGNFHLDHIPELELIRL